MSLFGVLGKITGFVADVVSEGIKESTGVDLKEMKRNYSSANEEYKNYQKELNELKANRERYIAEYGIKEYNEQVEGLKESMNGCVAVLKSDLENMKSDIEVKKSEYKS